MTKLGKILTVCTVLGLSLGAAVAPASADAMMHRHMMMRHHMMHRDHMMMHHRMPMHHGMMHHMMKHAM